MIPCFIVWGIEIRNFNIELQGGFWIFCPPATVETFLDVSFSYSFITSKTYSGQKSLFFPQPKQISGILNSSPFFPGFSGQWRDRLLSMPVVFFYTTRIDILTKFSYQGILQKWRVDTARILLNSAFRLLSLAYLQNARRIGPKLDWKSPQLAEGGGVHIPKKLFIGQMME